MLRSCRLSQRLTGETRRAAEVGHRRSNRRQPTWRQLPKARNERGASPLMFNGPQPEKVAGRRQPDASYSEFERWPHVQLRSDQRAGHSAFPRRVRRSLVATDGPHPVGAVQVRRAHHAVPLEPLTDDVPA